MKFIIKAAENELSWLWLTFSLFHLSLIHFHVGLSRYEPSENQRIHIEFSDCNEGALLGAFRRFCIFEKINVYFFSKI